jgi:NodT family efflux transporter outer membrane factor (OMF) lipoprotein
MLGEIRKIPFAVTALSLALAGCAVGPNYKRPPAPVPTEFKEAGNWKPAQPKDELSRGKWWASFGDPMLDGLLQQIDISNQTLIKAEATYRQSQALVEQARSSFFPTITANAGATRSKASSNTISQPTPTPISRGVVINHTLSGTVAWEPDFWGQFRRQMEENEANAQASVADLETARLLAQATLAQDYFQLRSIDSQIKLYNDTLDAYQKALALTENQYKVGVAARADVVLAQTQLKTAKAQAIDLDVMRTQLEHAIALLVGKPPAEFAIPRMPLNADPPAIPITVPSALLERRPDVAAAERRMAAANAQIGVAKAAFFPVITLSATGGYQAANFNQWITTPSRFWSLGPSLAATLFDGGLRRAQTNQAIAAYDAAVAIYRQAVLTGFQQVEDNLAALRVLEDEATVQTEATRLAEQSLALAINQYKAGTVSYLNVVTAAATALTNERASFDILNRRMSASVLLVEALGGGWNESDLPNDKAMVHDSYKAMPKMVPISPEDAKQDAKPQ